jgi:hypothetical protein
VQRSSCPTTLAVPTGRGIPEVPVEDTTCKALVSPVAITLRDAVLLGGHASVGRQRAARWPPTLAA